MEKISKIILSFLLLTALTVPAFASISNYNPQNSKDVKSLWNNTFSNQAYGRKGDKGKDIIKPALPQYRHGVKAVKKYDPYTKVLSGSTYSADKGSKTIKATGNFNFTDNPKKYLYFNANAAKPKVAYTGYRIWDDVSHSYVRLYITAEVTGFSDSANQSSSWNNNGKPKVEYIIFRENQQESVQCKRKH